MTPMHAEHSPDESVRCEGGNVNVNRITIPPTRDLVLGTLLAASILCNVFVFEYARDVKTIAWVTSDALQKFQTTQLPELQSRINTAEKLAEAYGLKESLEHYHYQSGESPKAVGSDRRPGR